MRKSQKREITLAALILGAIPAIFLALGALNFFIIKDSEQGWGFLISGLVALVICGLIFFFECRHIVQLGKLTKERNLITATLDELSIEDGVLQVGAHYVQDATKYHFGALFGPTSEAQDQKILAAYQSGNLKTIPVIVDLAKPKIFKIQINSWLKDYDIESHLELYGTSFSEEAIVIGES